MNKKVKIVKQSNNLGENKIETQQYIYHKNTGVTLIVLIITIILLLILAMVTINLTLGENGILKYAQIAKNKYNEEQEKEKNSLEEMYSQILVADGGKVTLTMEQLDEYINRKLEEKNTNKANIIAKSSQTYTTSSSEKDVNINFDSIMGDTKNKFILDNGKVRIGTGVKRILVIARGDTKCSNLVGAYVGMNLYLNSNKFNETDCYARTAVQRAG